MITARIANRCSLDFGREASALSAVQGGVGNTDPWPAGPFEDQRVAGNEPFRDMLRSSFSLCGGPKNKHPGIANGCEWLTASSRAGGSLRCGLMSRRGVQRGGGREGSVSGDYGFGS
jgi:hypothetical protein